MSFLGSNIVFRNTSNRNDFGDVKSLQALKQESKGNKKNNKSSTKVHKQKHHKKKRKRLLYFHVHLEDHNRRSDDDDDGEEDDEDEKYAADHRDLLLNSNNNNNNDIDDSDEDNNASLQILHNKNYNSFGSVKRNKKKLRINPKTVYIDKSLPRPLKQVLAASCERMGFALGKPNNSTIWWCSSNRDKSMNRINEMIEKINVNKATFRSRVNFYCGMRYSLHKVNLASKIEMYSLLLGEESFKFVGPTFILRK